MTSETKPNYFKVNVRDAKVCAQLNKTGNDVVLRCIDVLEDLGVVTQNREGIKAITDKLKQVLSAHGYQAPEKQPDE